MKKYGFLGIGIMGKAMAANLLHAGFEVMVWNRNIERCSPLIDMGARQGKSPAEVVADSDITFAMVSDPAAAESLCFAQNGVLDGVSAGKGYVDVSTVDPETAMKIGRAIQGKGGRYLEAPVSGSKKPAEDGALVFLCAGDRALYDEAGPALQVMGKKSFYFPEIGQGAQMKLVINMIMGSMMTAFGEGLALGDKLGLPMTSVLDVLAQGAINNPMFQLKGPLMAEGNFNPAFPLKHMQKDMRLALLMGDQHGQPLHTAAAANNAFIKARNSGFGDEDFSAVLKAITS
ncbi:NAD(P)-dependent oxidoreductase [Desulfopila aestuarii]|uniref:2-hydroxy-3-oxopropionate reductase n=1 Tax=Desulfopila aestuarii DSM 18488 TaxID=1121416 RepID=A0A1M7Y5Y8_9BACT|nr:NAD(P)-dependent oxidoreductase [Desulfopila aestuarii]SHO47801.1 2-hydroxy-3-oxopropionate reductase [Desulfopila aestuarii DSM 18488]